MEPYFKPWIGENYEGSKPKILVLGESHYGELHEYKSDFTQNVIKSCAITSDKGSRPFFTKIAKILTGKPYEWISSEEKTALWHQIAFCNYVQEFVGGKARIRPTSEMWTNAEASLRYVLETYMPDIVIVTGKELSRHIKTVTENYNGPAKFFYWTHPSARTFNKKEAIDSFDQAKSRFVL